MATLRKLLITEPTSEPVTSDEVKEQCVIEHSDHDAMIDRLLKAARIYVEQKTGRSLIRQKWRVYQDFFVNAMELPRQPVQNIDSMTYVDIDGNSQTVTASIYEFNQAEQILRLAYGQVWPSTRSQNNAVYVDFWTGYFDNTVSPIVDAAVPEALRAAIIMIACDLYENRGTQTEIQLYTNRSVDLLLQPYWIPHV